MSLVLTGLALATSTPAAQADSSAGARYTPCALSLADQRPPGGTPAYNLTVARVHASCATAVQIMKRFHRCRTSARVGCPRKLLHAWRCTGARAVGGPTIYGRFTCAAPRSRRVRGTYQQDTPSCLGAAARDPELRCFSRARIPYPKPGTPDPEPLCVCDFGVPATEARRHVALIGDSHTLHWRAALQVVAAAERWHGVTIATGGCFFSAAVGSFSEGCMPWYENSRAWLRQHREVDTVFVTSNADTPVAVPAGMTMDEVKIDGFRRAWRALPRTVEHLVALRDLTKSTPETFACIGEAARSGTRRLAPVCPLPRSRAQHKDLAIETVGRLHDKRYQAIDLSGYICGRRTCHPVVGGVLVNADQWGHMSPTFMRTLGPYMLRGVRQLEASW